MKLFPRMQRNRGMSVLAAVVLAAILGVVGYSVGQIRASYIAQANPSALSATAIEAGTGYKTSTQQDIAKACKQAIADAMAGKTSMSETAKAGDNVNDSCVAAVRDSFQPNGYRCVGKTAIVTIDTAGNKKVTTTANGSVPAGTCRTIACSASTVSTKMCFAADRIGFSTQSAQEILKDDSGSGVTTFWMSNGRGDLTDSGMNATEQSIIQQAFGGDGTTIPLDSTGQIDTSSTASQLDQLASLTPNSAVGAQQDGITTAAISLNSDLGSNIGTVGSGAGGEIEAGTGQHAGEIEAGTGQVAVPGTNPSATNQPVYPPTLNPYGSGPGKASPGSTFPNKNNGGTLIGPVNSSNSSWSSKLMQFVSGIARGIAGTGAGLGTQQLACTSDQNTYNSQLQQYQSNMTQYNYQLQEYNMQLQQCQLLQQRGVGCSIPPQPTPPAQPCYDPSASSECTSSEAQEPSASACTVGEWKPIYSGACVVNWQCVSTGNTGTTGGGDTSTGTSDTNTPPAQPSASLSCSPQIADASTTVTIAYQCSNAATSTTAGFSTADPLVGTSTAFLSAPANAKAATYRLTCINQSLTASKQCTVQIAWPRIVLVATPSVVASGTTANLGWITTSMKACTISSPEQTDFTARNTNNQSVNGVASTSPITKDTSYVLTCTTAAGNTKTATTTVHVE